MFVWGKNDLNPEQEKAIYNENSILLIACPGSGKTRLRQRCQKGRETTSAPFLQTVKARVKEET